MLFIKKSKSSWKYALIVVISTIIVSGGILTRWYLLVQKEEIKILWEEKKLSTILEEYKYRSFIIGFSPDGNRVAYYVHTKDEKEFVVINDREEKTYNSIRPESFLFSPDSKHYAYVVEKEDKEFLVFDGQESGPYDYVDGFLSLDEWSSHFAFSPDSKHFAYRVEEEKKKFVVFDGEKGEFYDVIGPAIFSPDSKHFTYIAERGEKIFKVIDGQEQEIKDIIPPLEESVKDVALSPDFNHIAYVTYEEGQECIVIDEKKGNCYDFIEDMVFSPDSQHFAFVAKEGEKQFLTWEVIGEHFIVVDGKEKKHYYFVIAPTFSPDSKSLAYVASSEKIEREQDGGIVQTGRVFVVLNDKEGKYYDALLYGGKIIFSPDSAHISYVAVQDEKTLAVFNDTEGKFSVGEILFGEGIDIPVYSPDSKHIAYVVSSADEGTFVVVDGNKGKSYYNPGLSWDKIVGVFNLGFSSDNKYVYYGVIDGNEAWWVVGEIR